ncbi:MAG: hypothetical protein IPK58_23735 [Acidobacteria bacterium]|nr:hypothetical protein [Acidobacteriota bacterium]
MKSAVVLSERFRELGEHRRALSYLADVTLQSNRYRRTSIARWRAAIYTSSALEGIGIPRAAEAFATEALTTASEGELRTRK